MKTLHIKHLAIVALAFLLVQCSYKTNTNTQQTLTAYTYKNPILHIDYSDPDVVQAGNKYYMTASSFNCVPGLPLLESNNLVDWKLIAYALTELSPDSAFSKPQHGNGVWAPSIRYYKNKFYIYYGDPDYGIFMLTAKDIKGPWSKPHLVKAGKGWIDPCPIWDENGDAWLIHAWAGSRAGIKSTLTLHKMSKDGKELLDNGMIVFDGHNGNTTVEGPKIYKRNDYYYILAPAGGVKYGWQLALRSKNITGPYEVKKVLHQGNSNINGPHQGAWVDGKDGSSWFIHFQDKDAFGRIVHMQPVNWLNDWPEMGIDANNDGIGEPVSSYQIMIPENSERIPHNISDEFNEPELNKNWQWHANPSPYWGAPTGRLGYLRLNAAPFPDNNSLWQSPNLLLQKFPANQFSVITKLDVSFKEEGDQTGLLIMGEDYAWIGIERNNNLNYLVYNQCYNARKKGKEQNKLKVPFNHATIYLKVNVDTKGICTFHYSFDNKQFTTLKDRFTARKGRWIGAKVGLFCQSKSKTNDAGYVNVDWFRVSVN